MTEAFIERILELDGAGRVPVRIFKPEPEPTIDPEFFDHRCQYEVGWPQGTVTQFVTGVDSFQAVIVALTVVHAYLLASPEYKDGRLTWLGSGHLGLPALRPRPAS